MRAPFDDMICGDPLRFAIESEISHAYPDLGSRALGFFVLHVGGLSYGVRAPDATLLACSLDDVETLIAERGLRRTPFVEGVHGGVIADAFRDAIYTPDQEESFFSE